MWVLLCICLLPAHALAGDTLLIKGDTILGGAMDTLILLPSGKQVATPEVIMGVGGIIFTDVDVLVYSLNGKGISVCDSDRCADIPRMAEPVRTADGMPLAMTVEDVLVRGDLVFVEGNSGIPYRIPARAALSLLNLDGDGDGYTHGEGDCNDSDPFVSPEGQELCEDGIDNDCDGYLDLDDLDCAGGSGSSGDPVSQLLGCGTLSEPGGSGGSAWPGAAELMLFTLILAALRRLYLASKEPVGAEVEKWRA
jgi:hypothetical protein